MKTQIELMKSSFILKYEFQLLVFIEFFIFFYLGNKLEFIVSPIILTATSLFIAYKFLIQKNELIPDNANYEVKKIYKLLYVLLLILFGFWAYFIMLKNPIDIKTSDIIPYINDLYLKRLFNGEFIYNLAPGLGYGNWTPNYLPFHWLPFAISYYFQFDHRWIVFGTYLIAVYIYLFHFIKAQTQQDFLIKACLPFIFLIHVFFKQSGNFAHTVELLIASYYFILAMFIIKNNVLGKSIGLVITVLSRYIVVFYIPIALLIEYYLNNKKILIQIVLVIVMISAFYLIPFLLKDTSIFFKGAASYDLAALGEWNGQSWQQAHDRPHQLFQGLGFASWAYSFLNGSLENRIYIFKTIMLLITCISILIIGIYFIKNKHKHSLANWHLASLKVILTIVISFSLVPYSYLFWSTIILSIVMVSKYIINDKI